MLRVEEKETIRRAYFIEGKSMRAIAREQHCSRKTIRKALADAGPETYKQQVARAAPLLGDYKQRIAELLAENESLPRKQRYTGQRIYEVLVGEGYRGAASTVRGYIAAQRQAQRRPQVYLPLEFDPGKDAQVDWGEGLAEIAGQRVTVQLFYMRLSYSRRMFVMAFPTQRQEAFFLGHVKAFQFFGGVAQRISYDNLKAAVLKILEGHTREEQSAFAQLRSHYLFTSHYCTPGQAHEKGGVEHGVGFGRRNYLVPVPQVQSFAELNALLLAACLKDDQRTVDRQPLTIGEAWQQERPHLRPLPARAFDPRLTRTVSLNPYSQVVFETNRYSVPVEHAQKHLVLKADPFEVTIIYLDEVLARHPRCYARQQDILDPLHYLPLLAQRPGALEHAKPLRQWRQQWPPVYEQALEYLRQAPPEKHGMREFIRILDLHREYPGELVAQAIQQALALGCVHRDGVQLCLHQLLHPADALPSLDLSALPHLATVAAQPPDLQRYDQLLPGGVA